MRLAKSIILSSTERSNLEALAWSPRSAVRDVTRAQIILLAAEQKQNTGIAIEVGVNINTVQKWRNRFVKERLKGLRDQAGRGRKRTYDLDKVAAIIETTLQTIPTQATHWSTRTLAKQVGVSHMTVQRIWNAHHIQPHLVRTFKLSTDPHFTEKLRDVVGLYLRPPEHSIVLCVDEKSQIQALDRTQPTLPLKPGR